MTISPSSLTPNDCRGDDGVIGILSPLILLLIDIRIVDIHVLVVVGIIGSGDAADVLHDRSHGRDSLSLSVLR